MSLSPSTPGFSDPLGTPFREHFLETGAHGRGPGSQSRACKGQNYRVCVQGPRGDERSQLWRLRKGLGGACGVCGLGGAPEGGQEEGRGPTAPVLLPLPCPRTRIQEGLSGTWTRDSPTASRAAVWGCHTAARCLWGPGQIHCWRSGRWGNMHVCLATLEDLSLQPCPPLLQPALCPPTLRQGGSTAQEATRLARQPPGHRTAQRLPRCPCEGKKAQPCPAVGLSGSRPRSAHRARQRLTVPRPASAVTARLGPLCSHVPAITPSACSGGYHVVTDHMDPDLQVRAAITSLDPYPANPQEGLASSEDPTEDLL